MGDLMQSSVRQSGVRQSGVRQSGVRQSGVRQSSVRQARANYFADNNFGADGGYNDAWVDFSIGPVPLPFPNTPMRVRAVRYHDLHHIVTGYRTDLRGELEIAAWEVGAGCGSYLIPWQLNLAGMALGVMFMPRRLFIAFVRGRRSKSLYGADFEPLLELTVAELQSRSLGSGQLKAAGAADYAWFVAALPVATLILLLSLIMGVFTVPLGLVAQQLKNRQRTDNGVEPLGR